MKTASLIFLATVLVVDHAAAQERRVPLTQREVLDVIEPAQQTLARAPLNRSISDQPQAELSVDEDGASLAVNYGKTVAYGKDFGKAGSRSSYTTVAFTASLPIAGANGDGKLATLDALASGSSLEFKLANSSTSRAPNISQETLEGICLANLANPADASTVKDRCSTGMLTPKGVKAFNDAIWGENPRLTTWGVGARVGTETFDYLEPTTLAERSTDETSWSLKAFWNHSPLDGRWLVAVGYEHQDAYEAADEKILCPPGGTGDDCVKGPAGSPSHVKKDIFSTEGRYRGDDFAINGLLQYDAKSDVFGAEVPIFLSRDGNGAFNGGLKLSWRSDTDEVVAGVFFGAPLPPLN